MGLLFCLALVFLGEIVELVASSFCFASGLRSFLYEWAINNSCWAFEAFWWAFEAFWWAFEAFWWAFVAFLMGAVVTGANFVEL